MTYLEKKMYSTNRDPSRDFSYLQVDIWSVGVILFEALFGRAPFSSQTLDQLINKIKENNLLGCCCLQMYP